MTQMTQMADGASAADDADGSDAGSRHAADPSAEARNAKADTQMVQIQRHYKHGFESPR